MDTQNLYTYRSSLITEIEKINCGKTLDKIHQVIGSDVMLMELESALSSNGLTDKQVSQFVDALNNTQGTLGSKTKFVNNLKDNLVINVDALLQPESWFSDIFPSSFASEMFIQSAPIGTGAKLAGPGEHALVGFSNEIEFAQGKGDIMVNGVAVEVKAATGRQGGRLGESTHAPSREKILEVISKHSISLAYSIEQKKSFALIPFIRKAHLNLDTEQDVADLLAELVDLTFPGHGKAVGDSFLTCKDYDEVEIEYMRQNFIWYKASHGFDSVLALAIGSRKMFNISTPEYLADLRRRKKLGAGSISIWPSKPQEVFTQLNFTTKT